MLYTLATRTILPRAMASIRVTCKPGDFSSVLSETRTDIHYRLIQQGVQATGPDFVRYHQINTEQLDAEVGVLLAQSLSENDELDTFHIGELPGGLVAVARHIGPYNELGKIYAAMETWVEEQGYTLAGEPWEIYWTDQQAEPDTGRWKADVIWPLK
jgi:effector-binding domain-containing protein